MSELSPLELAQLKAALDSVPHWSRFEACLYLGITQEKLKRLTSDGYIKARIKGHGIAGNMYLRDDIYAYLNRHRKAVAG